MISVEHKMELQEKIEGGMTLDEIVDIVWDDAIDEAINYFSDHAGEVYSHVSARDFICDRLEQLKEGAE